ncbi:hypothetical protein L2729_00880 [Shewanella gelidimarina]|uniref:hypothetical protein n=1 Tax=Shewanella gelidimarina TaxID=56813 RepID=UPI00200DA6C7|nr:hypothetical protein [Shewanella gelidimarina]MCL1056544.1 hypothetical protein [Shewanella gelidimarina]
MRNNTRIEKDDLMDFFLREFGVENSSLLKQEIAVKIGVSLDSFSYRIEISMLLISLTTLLTLLTHHWINAAKFNLINYLL